MVGYRNVVPDDLTDEVEFIRHSDGGVSEHRNQTITAVAGVYQAFRWWGIGTKLTSQPTGATSLSGIPMVGYRNSGVEVVCCTDEFIRHSDGGVSEL